MRWTDGKAGIGAPIICTVFIMRKEVPPTQQAGCKKTGILTNSHAVKLTCSAGPIQFMNVAKEHLP
jgi:hypothetical protein